MLLQTLLRREGHSRHAIVGYFEVMDSEEGRAGERTDCKMCPRVSGRGRSSTCRAPRYLKVSFESVVVFREPYFLEPADIGGILHRESLTPQGPPLSSISREEFYQDYDGVAYVWQWWISYRMLRDRQSILEELVEKALSRTEVLEIRIREWPRIIGEVVREVRRLMPRQKPRGEILKRFKAALRFAGLTQYINILVPHDCCSS